MAIESHRLGEPGGPASLVYYLTSFAADDPPWFLKRPSLLGPPDRLKTVAGLT
jgi:hypothetical protein